MSEFDKYFVSPFDIKHFSEAEFDKQAQEKTHASVKDTVQGLFGEFKTSLDALESVIASVESEELRNAFNKIVDVFARLEIETNKL